MAHYREPNERFLSPEYWGMDIDDPNAFENPQASVYLAASEQYDASLVLASCLEDTLTRRNSESPLASKVTEFPAHDMKVPDNTVVIIDSERLSKFEYDREHKWDPPERLVDPAIDAVPSFLSMWRNNQGTSDYTSQGKDFGEELAMYADEHKMYTRMLRWGVLLTRQVSNPDVSPSRPGRYAATWKFDLPVASSGGVVVPVNPTSEILRPGLKLPIGIERTQAQEDMATFHSAMRTIERVRAVEVVQVPEPH